jgi:hypothetical protein
MPVNDYDNTKHDNRCHKIDIRMKYYVPSAAAHVKFSEKYLGRHQKSFRQTSVKNVETDP